MEVFSFNPDIAWQPADPGKAVMKKINEYAGQHDESTK
jgi:hypothetical protein